MKKKNWIRLRIALYVFLSPLLVMLLWNFVMPSIFGLVTINYLEAFALKMLFHLCFTNNLTVVDDMKKIDDEEETFKKGEELGIVKKEKE